MTVAPRPVRRIGDRNPEPFPMRFLRRASLWALVALSAVILTGCEEEAETSVVPAHLPAPDPANPLAGIPRDQLYGAGPVENLWSPRADIEILDLPPGWHGARVAVITDLALGLWDGNEEVADAAIRRAIEARPDLIALLGDYVTGWEGMEALERVLASLQGQRAVAVLGDRDIRTDSLEARVVEILEANDVQVLRNSSAAVAIRGDTAFVAGIDPDMVRMNFADQQWILATLGETGRTPLLLTHLPALATRAPEGRFPLILSGGTFCGQIEIPGTPRLSWVQNEALPGAYIQDTQRLFRVQGSTLFVACGIGYGFVPIRFAAPPEVAIVTLSRVGPRTPEVDSGSVADTLIQRFQRPPAEEPAPPAGQ